MTYAAEIPGGLGRQVRLLCHSVLAAYKNIDQEGKETLEQVTDQLSAHLIESLNQKERDYLGEEREIPLGQLVFDAALSYCPLPSGNAITQKIQGTPSPEALLLNERHNLYLEAAGIDYSEKPLFASTIHLICLFYAASQEMEIPDELKNYENQLVQILDGLGSNKYRCA